MPNYYYDAPPDFTPDEAIRHWYTVTDVKVVQRKGQWVERVSMRRNG